MENKTHLPFEAIHPGTLLKDEIDCRPGLTQKELARELGVKPSFLNEIIKEKRAITADFAILLEKTLSISAAYWMRFQSQYDIDKARIKEKNRRRMQAIDTWNILKKQLPLDYFKKHKILSDSIEKDIATLLEFYNADTIESLLTNASKQKPEYFENTVKQKV